MKRILPSLILVVLATTTQAYTNDTMTEAYKKLVAGDPIHAIHEANTEAWGDWWWLSLFRIGRRQ